MGGDVLLAYSEKLKQLARDATIGMTDAEVMRRTDLSYSTWRRIVDGQVPGQDKLVQFAVGLGLSVEEVLTTITGADSPIEPGDMIRWGLERSPLSPAGRLKVMTLYRHLVEEQQQRSEEQSAA